MKDLFFDTETTGIPAKGAHYDTDFDNYPRIVSIAWKVNDEPAQEHIINQQGFQIPESSIEVHGITNEMAEASKTTIIDALKLMEEQGRGADRIIAHNLYFDSSIIKANLLRLKAKELYDKITELLHKDKRYDTMRAATSFCKLPGKYGYKWPKLEELYWKLFKERFKAHSSGADVEATYRCFHELWKLGVIKPREKK